MSVIRLPKANVWFDKQTDATLATYAQAIHDGLVASVGDFPTPPVGAATLQTSINSYVSALSLAYGPGSGKINTAAKDAAKETLKYNLRINCVYVNQIIYDASLGGQPYTFLQNLILETGYQLSKDPSPVGPLSTAGSLVKSYSNVQGQYYILLKKISGAKGYIVNIFDQTTGLFVRHDSFPSTRINIVNLISGHTYDFSIAAIGSNPERNFDLQINNKVVI